MNLTREQLAAHDAIVNALQSGNACLTGGPGTGKTFTTRAIVQTLQNMGLQVGACASTNKAASVMQDAIGNDIAVMTIHKMCGLRLIEDRGKQYLQQGGPGELANFDVVLVDESSMLEDKVVDIAESQATASDTALFDDVFGEALPPRPTRLLYIGDGDQLPPVGQPYLAKPFRDIDITRVRLTTVMRQAAGSNIVSLLEPIRQHIENDMPLTIGAFSETRLHDLLIVPRTELDAHMQTLSEHEDAVFIGWTNRTVDAANQRLREIRYGARALTADFIPGESILFRSPLMERGTRIVANAGDTATVTDVDNVVEKFELAHGHVEHVKFLELGLKELGRSIQVVDRTSVAGWRNVMNYKYAEAARSDDTASWRDYYATQRRVADVQTHHAITAHRSQGSTYDRVVVDVRDVLANPNTDEAARCLYVACSRPRSHLTLIC